MFKFTLRTLVLFSLIVVSVASCIDDPAPTVFGVNTVQGTYKITQLYAVDSITSNFYMIHDSLPLCQKAVVIKLNSSGTYNHIYNDSSCLPLPPFLENGSWKIGADNMSLVVDTSHLAVSTFSANQLVVWYHSSYRGRVVNISETLTRQ